MPDISSINAYLVTADEDGHITAGLTLFHAAHRDFSCFVPEYLMMPFLKAAVKQHTLYTDISDIPNDLQEDSL